MQGNGHPDRPAANTRRLREGEKVFHYALDNALFLLCGRLTRPTFRST